MNHDHNFLDGVISAGALLVATLTSDKTLIFLSIVLVLIRIFVALTGKRD